MSVYVDNMRAAFANMIMCHMVADTHKELVEMADTIKVQRKWIQNPGQHGEHFDIALTKRALAIKNGAKEISFAEFGHFLIARRKKGKVAYFG